MEVFSSGMVLSLDDYRSATIAGSKARGWSAPGADKGHMAMLKAFAAGLRTGRWPVSLDEQIAASRASLDVEQLINPSAAWADKAG
jgi:hypothetical protein